MPYTSTALNGAVSGIAGLGTYISLHSGDPSTTGANEVTTGTGANGRQATTWGAAANGVRAGTQVAISVAGGTTVSYWGIWTAQTAGTFLYGGTLSASETFGSAGTLQHTPTITVTN